MRRSRIGISIACAGLFVALLAAGAARAQGGAGEGGVSLQQELRQGALSAGEAAVLPFGDEEVLKALAKSVVKAAPVSPLYLIGPQDEIIINLWGKKTLTLNPVVDEEGFVKFTLEGVAVRFSVNGLFFKDLKTKVVRELSRLTSDIDPEHPESSQILVDVTLGKIRGINVMVLGDVKNPGQYTMNTTISSVFNVLSMAGGLTPGGSMREIIVRRPGGQIENVDLYQFDLYNLLGSGQVREELLHLRDGDIVVVPPKLRVVTLVGEVKRPGRYEIRENESLKCLLQLAGGFTPQARTASVRLLRVKEGTEARLSDVDVVEQADFPLMDGDEITVAAKPDTRRLNAVEVKGDGVRQPGLYQFQEGMTLASLLERAGGLYEDAMKSDAVLVRTRPDYTLEFQTLSLDEDAAPGKSSMKLQPMDRLIVYSRFHREGGEKFVSIEGHVKEPGRYVLSTKMALADLIFMGGGFADTDFLRETWMDRADLVRVDPVSQRKTIIPFDLRGVLDGREEENIMLQSGDAVRVYSFAEMQDRRTVTVGGEVRAPGDFELTAGMTLADVIAMARGLSDDADPDRIEIARRPDATASDGQAAQLLVVSAAGTNANGVVLEPRDRVIVRGRVEIREKGSVSVAGQVAYPGDYVLASRTERLSELVDRAGGFLQGAAPEGARLWRRATANGAMATNTQEVAIDLVRALAHPRGPYDLLLLDGDRLNVPRQNWTVEVKGAVLQPQTVQYVAGKPVSYYLNFVGGFGPTADRRHTLLVYPNREVRKAMRFWFLKPRVAPGCVIIVPEKPSAIPVAPAAGAAEGR